MRTPVKKINNWDDHLTIQFQWKLIYSSLVRNCLTEFCDFRHDHGTQIQLHSGASIQKVKIKCYLDSPIYRD